MSAQVDWTDLEESVRRAIETVRLTPRHVPGAIEMAAGSVRNARERLEREDSRATDLLRGLGEVEAAVRAAGARLGLSTRYLEEARRRLRELKGSAAAPTA